MNETDVIGHLIQIESEAAEMLLNAQTEVDQRITESKQKADNLYKEKYEQLIAELEQNLNQEKNKIDEQIQIKFDSYKEKITTITQDKRAINSKLQNLIFGSTNG